MPGYRGHLLGGVVVFFFALLGILLWCNPTTTTALEWLGFTLCGALFPDIDIKSKGQKLFYWLLAGLFILLISMNHLQMVAVLSVIALVPMLVRHRGMFHRPWFIILLPSAIAYILCAQVPSCKMIIVYDTFFFILGALSHLWLDMGRRMFRW